MYHQLVTAAIDRAETFESSGVGKASKSDLTHYVMEIAAEIELSDPVNMYSDLTIGAALFSIWKKGV